MDVTALNPTTTTAPSVSPTNAADTQDRFLKLLVAQMQNQDPMNPMDNAQVTSQMAQIQTVSGISTLNTSVQALGNQMQAVQGVALVGHTVTVASNQLPIANNTGNGSYSLGANASAVQLDVLNSAGVVISSQQLGAQSAGMQSFNWPIGNTDPSAKLTFKITASNGSTAIPATTYAQDKVVAVNTSSTGLKLDLQNLGMVDYSSVATIN